MLALLMAGETQAQTVLYKCVDGDQVTYSERLIDCRQAPKKAKAPSSQPADDLPPPGVNMAAEIQAQFEREQAEREEAKLVKAVAEQEQKKVEAARLEAEAQQKLEEQKWAEERERRHEAACAEELKKAPVVRNSAWDGGVYQVEQYLKRVLKDPGSFDAIEWSPVVRSCTGYVVRVRYRARNSFGGMVISQQLFSLDTRGVVTGAVDL
ncbi:hypothetical protein [Thauera sp.]|uniref:hypothetical protein n=1 Tax=Thauera sp. TaxID=1905334 RepID=UPI0039E62A02